MILWFLTWFTDLVPMPHKRPEMKNMYSENDTYIPDDAVLARFVQHQEETKSHSIKFQLFSRALIVNQVHTVATQCYQREEYSSTDKSPLPSFHRPIPQLCPSSCYLAGLSATTTAKVRQA